MKSGLKVFHWVIILWILIFILQFNVMIKCAEFVIEFIGLIFSDFSTAMILLDFNFLDLFLSATLFALTLPLIFIFRKRINLISTKLNFSFAFIVVLSFLFLFAPLITNQNPEFSKNLSVTKLLPPLTYVKQINLNDKIQQSLSKAELFRMKFNDILKPAFNEQIVFADSIKLSDTFVIYQKNNAREIEKSLIAMESGTFLVKTKLFLLGTDEFGRDLFSRLVYGTRVSISVGLAAVLISFFIGVVLGFLAGYFGGIADVVLNRFTEMFLAFPVIYIIVLILALFGSSIFSVVIVLGVSGWMSLFKIVKTETVSVIQKDFFVTAELVGLSKTQLLKKEIIPVIISPVLVNLVFLFSNVILAEAALSYLGLGTGSSYPSWGSMISSGQEYITKAWWLIVFPGLALILTLFAFNISGKIFNRRINPIISR